MNSMIGFGLMNLVIGLFSFWGYSSSKDDQARGQFRLFIIVSILIVLTVGITECYKAYYSG